jgi:ABC-type multidrug transport system ATPase subunit
LWLRPFKKDILLDFDFSKIIDDFQIEDLFKEFEFKPNLIINLKRYTPIENLRLRQPIIFNKSLKDNTIYVDFLLFEFSVNNSWYTWNELSDGTKRIFYIVSQIIGWGGLIFLEEPELGIHPDQLHKLMDFLIEQSKEKQIIITTHSPEVLNAIHPDELDRIIVTRYDAEKGTVMKKLSPEQAKEMGDRIKEGDMFLSDRWVHLNLEDEIFNAAQLDEK